MKRYDEDGWFLSYPDDWEVAPDEDGEGESLTLLAPDGGFWSIQRFPMFAEPDDMVQECADALAHEYKDCELTLAFDKFEKFQLDGLDLDFIYLDFPCLARIRGVLYDSVSYLLYAQMMDLNLENRALYDAVTKSWVEGLE